MRKLVILFFTIILSAICSAAVCHASGLAFSQVDVKIDDHYQSDIGSEETAKENAEPQSSIKIDAELENTFTSSENVKVKDIRIKATIKELDEGRDVKDQSESFDLSQGNSRVQPFKFDVPLEIEQDTYKVVIDADGYGSNGISQSAEFIFYIFVEKKSREVRILKAEAIPNEISCGDAMTFSAELINLGRKSEENARIDIISSDLGIRTSDNGIELSSDPFDSDSRYEKSYSFNIPSNANPGQYAIDVNAFFDDIPADRKTVMISVRCGAQDQALQPVQDNVVAQPVQQDVPENPAILPVQDNPLPDLTGIPLAEPESQSINAPAQQSVQDQQPQSNQAAQETKAYQQPSPQYYSHKPVPLTSVRYNGEKDFFASNDYLVVLVIINVIIACGIIYLISLMMKKM